MDPKDTDAQDRAKLQAQTRKMQEAATRHPPSSMPGNREPNAGGVNREKGDRKARTNDRATNGGE